MKPLRFLALLALTALSALGAEPQFVTFDGRSYPAIAVTNATLGTVAGTVVFGGLGKAGDPSWAGKVVLVDRGEITFAEKVRNAKSSGAIAVIIANNVAGPTNATLAPDSSDLPVVTITQADGVLLKEKIGTVVRVGAAPPPVLVPDPTGHIGEYLMSDGAKLIYAKPAPPKPPVITPSAGDATAGSIVTLIATADGIPPPTFQWKKDGQILEGKNQALLEFNLATIADSGTYTVTATNEAGSAESPPYKLTVLPAP